MSVSSTCVLRISLTVVFSNILHSHRGHHHDRYYDLPHSQQIHRSRKKGNCPFLLDVCRYTAVGNILGFGHYTDVERSICSAYAGAMQIYIANPFVQWFAAVYTGLVASAYCCILINAFVGFQFAEDGTPLSLWFLRIACLVVFGVAFFIAIATFKSFASFSYSKTLPLWIIYILWPVICVAIYIVSQLVLVFRTLEDRWPIGDIVFGTSFWVVGMVILFAFSTTICDAIKHYIDGLFFSELCVLLSVMMVYKYWDSITVSTIYRTSLTVDRLTLFNSARISNSQWAPSRPYGRSRIPFSHLAILGPQMRPHPAEITQKKTAVVTITAVTTIIITGMAQASQHP